MMGRVRDWLPPGAAMAPRLRAGLEGVVDAWSRTWFAGAHASLRVMEPQAADPARNEGGRRLYHGSVALKADGPEAIRLAGLALGADLAGVILSEPDRDIVDRLAASILGDLAAALAAAVGLPVEVDAEPVPCPDTFRRDPGVRLSIADAQGHALCQAVLPTPALVPFLKAGIAARPAPPLGRLAGAVGRTGARLDIRLGEARLGLGELAGLAVGDVLVLDRKIDAGALLYVAPGRRGAFARAALDAGGDATRLLLAAEPGIR